MAAKHKAKLCFISILLIIFAHLLFSGALALAQPNSEGARLKAIVVEDKTGQVIYENQADKRTYPASLTKIMTLYLLFEALKSHKLRLSSPLHVSAYAASQPPTRLGLRPGDKISVQNAIFALITRSANDVAVVVAERMAPTERAFARIMTRKAHELKMKQTQFRNASGLPHARQITSARDMAILARRIRKDFPQYYSYFSTRSFVWRGEVIPTHNHLLEKYEGTTGLKTGYTYKSGYNLVAVVERSQRTLVGVVLGGPTSKHRDEEMMRLFNHCLTKKPRNYLRRDLETNRVMPENIRFLRKKAVHHRQHRRAKVANIHHVSRRG